MTILVTGASGFIGSYVLRELMGSTHQVRALVRPGSTAPLAVESENISRIEGDIGKPETLADAFEDCDAVIHLVGIIREHPSRGVTFERIHAEGTQHVVAAATRAGVDSFVHMSANGARSDGVSRYQTTKWQAEQAVAAAGFPRYTIFRPSLVFGEPDRGRPEFASDLVRQLIRPFPVLPVFGSGHYAMQPVAVRSLAKGMVAAVVRRLDDPIVPVGGPEALPYTEILDRLSRATGREPKPKINVPVPLVSLGISLFGWTGLLPITSDQLAMLVEGNTCGFERFHDTFGIDPVPFSPENLGYVNNE